MRVCVCLCRKKFCVGEVGGVCVGRSLGSEIGGVCACIGARR